MVELLLKYGSVDSQISWKGKSSSRQIPLHVACEKGKKQIVEVLLSQFPEKQSLTKV